MKFREEQITLGKQAYDLLTEYGLVYLAMEERTGKTGTSLVAAEHCSDDIKDVLVITKKKAMGKDPKHPEDYGWKDALEDFAPLLKKKYAVVNYHSAHKYKGNIDLVILDESHAYISAYPKTSTMFLNIYKLIYGKPIIYSSATPYAQGTQLLYHQFKMSFWSPFKKYKDFYAWFRQYAKRDKKGELPVIRISAERTATDYTAMEHDKVLAECNHLFITKTRAELGFKQEPKDQLHYIELNDTTKAVYNTIIEDHILVFDHEETDEELTLVCDSPIKLRWALHMLEGGVMKIDDRNIILHMNEKADYTMKTWGDIPGLVIMYNYTADRIKLEKMFKNARLLQATSYAEGVDLSRYRHLVIYSQNFSTSKYTQRRARQASKDREEDITVHYLLVKKAVSEQAYKTVNVNKTNFIDSMFEREKL